MSDNPRTLEKPADFIRMDYERRKKINSRFSLRAYAKHLDLSIGRLSELLAGKTHLTLARAKKIAPLLRLSKVELELFWGVIQNELLRADEIDGTTTEKIIDTEDFEPISDWEYFACMALFETKSKSADLQWISRKLKIPKTRLEAVLSQLIKAGYVSLEEGPSYKSNYKKLSTKSNFPSEVLRKANRDRLKKTLDDFDTSNINQRDVTSMTLPVDIDKIPEAKILIKKFKSDMMKLLQTGETSDVYFLNVQLIPISDTELISEASHD